MERNDLELWTQEQTAAICHVSAKTLEQWRIRGLGPRFVRLGGRKKGRIFYRACDLALYLDSVTHTSTSEESCGV